MTTLVYDGSFSGFLTGIFELYEYRFDETEMYSQANYQPGLIGKMHEVQTNVEKSKRVWKGLAEKLSAQAVRQVYRSFLSEEKNIENILLQYVRHIFANKVSVENDFAHPAILKVQQIAKMVYREKHRMEAFVRFQLTADGLFYAVVQPDFNVLPLIQKHFKERYADQRWMIYDSKRKYGIYYDLEDVTEVEMNFSKESQSNIASVYDEHEGLYQKLWQEYFSSVNIASRKNMKLHIRHMPKRYWKFLIEKKA